MSQKKKIADIREEYTRGELLEENIETNPISQFANWFGDALHHQVNEPNAMILSTVSAGEIPSARVVLLKEFDERGFVFFTNYESQKGRDMATNPNVSLLFFWPELQRQVRIWGQVRKLAAEASDSYFHSRPKGSQLGALASPQSQPVPDREFLVQRLEALTQEYRDRPINRPPHWGGYIVTPGRVEFWQGRANRMHDRLVFESSAGEAGQWTVRRLAP